MNNTSNRKHTQKIKFKRNIMSTILLSLFATTGSIQAQEERSDKSNEGWRILERQKWFEESRGLRDEPDARVLKDTGIEMMRVQERDAMMRALSSGELWQELGPSSMDMTGWAFGRVSGRHNAIVTHPGNENIIYFGAAAGGVWKTVDGGQRWTPVFDETGTLVIGDVTLDPANSERIWVGTGDRNGGGCAGYLGKGVFLSEDGGTSWQAKNGSGSTAMPLEIINSVVVSPTNSNIVLVGGFGACDSQGFLTGGGVYRTTDGGNSWSRVYSGLVEDMIFAPDGTTVYAGAPGAGVLRSTNAGASFNNSSSGLQASQRRMRIAMAPSNSNVLYAMGDNAALYRTVNGGSSWQLMNSRACEGQCTFNLALAVKPDDPNTVLIGSIRHAISTNGGQSLRYLTSNWGTQQTVHQDTHVLTWSQNNPNRYWVGTDGGIWRSDNAGSSFTNLNSNLNVTQFYDIAVDPRNADTVYGGAQDNSSARRTANDGKTWRLTYASGDGFMNVIDEDNPNIVFQTSYPNGGLPWIVRSTSGGAPGSFSQIPNTGLTPSNNFPWVMPLAGAGNRIWVASDRVYVASTTANPFRWTALSGNLGSAGSVLRPIRVNGSYLLMVGTSGGRIFKSTNPAQGGAQLTDVTGNYPGGRVSDIAIDESNLNRIFVTRSRFQGAKLYRTTSGGNSWQAVGNGLPSVPATSVAIDPNNPQRIFVGTDIGMFESTDGGDNFQSFNAGMPIGNTITDLEIHKASNSLLAGTYGRGAWRISLNTTEVPNEPPVAAFDVAANGLTVNFTDRSSDPDGSIESWSWSFGDGTSSSQQNPQKTYSAAGNFTVSLTVRDNRGAANTVTQQVTVSAINQAPEADFTFTRNGLEVGFTNTSSDSDGEIVSHEWDFGDGTRSTEKDPRKAYTESGTYTVKLTVTDNDGATTSKTQQVAVSDSNLPPTANFNFSADFLNVQFTNLSTDSDGSVVSSEWDFGDGSRTVSEENPRYTYFSPGSYNVQLTVTDNDGATDTFARTVEVSEQPVNSPPAANFSYTIDGLTVSFSDESTDSDGQVVRWDWNFGDRNSSAERNPRHTYAEEGSYDVELMVEDNRGATNLIMKSLTVTRPDDGGGDDGGDNGGGQCSGTTEVGYFWGFWGETNVHPNGSWYLSNSSGEHKVCLQLQGSATLTLEKWSWWWWTPVATGQNQLNYQGTPGYYRIRIDNQNSTGYYQIQYSKPN